MNHSPFEDWLLSGEPLNDAQKQALQAHLEDCQACTRLAGGWAQVSAAIRHTQPASPAPGFTNRFQASLIARRTAQQRRLAWRVFLGTLGAALVIGLVIWSPNLSALPDPISILASLLASATYLLAGLADTRTLLSALFRGVPLAIPLAVWIILAINLFVWSLIWVLSIWKIPAILRSRNEANR